ncbi:MAG: transporter ATP-binding protein [Chlorobi bacterium]|nr:transporter ATP-binding protein [Chlorobiota bacterium]
MIEFIDVRKTYGGEIAVNGVSLRVETGELCVLLGPSGCGKTTLLRMANRLVEPTSGTIMIDGEDIMCSSPVELRRRIGYAIQSVGLFPHRTVAQNIATTPELMGMAAGKIAARTDELLSMMNLEPARYRDRYPSQLSGGEAQRVGVARALAADPPLLLMDEPFGAIDPINRAEIREEFLALQRRLRKTIIFVSHDIPEALFLADRIALMRSGNIEQVGAPPELIASPATEFVKRFFGGDRRMLLLETTRVAEMTIPPAGPGNPRAAIAAESTLREALLALMSGDGEHLGIHDGNGGMLGEITLGDIQRHMALAMRADGEPRR